MKRWASDFWPAIVITLFLLALVVAKIAAQSYGLARLQGQAQIQESAEWATYRLRAVCDIGNGTMVYTAIGIGGGVAVAVQPGGCAKVRVQAEKGEQ